MLGASSKFSGQLMIDLASVTREYYALRQGRLTMSYLPMPTLLRSRGGLGTHWMMPAKVTIRDDAALSDSKAKPIGEPLNRWQTMALLTCLHDTHSVPPPQDHPCTTITTMHDGELGRRLSASPHAVAWQALIQDLAAKR